ncbi:Retrovirus-related Pol polyprotein LINE-1 [Senna tora]|uniref:Retrovirus-related Pol polyprotein LINE-1 n=1 Tax=Senna tora TaxID=362788 RepID=A0A834SH09_9FABA|nr:Retrovirus-related Pol polyprotein LINE-1 [Senna tora]
MDNPGDYSDEKIKEDEISEFEDNDEEIWNEFCPRIKVLPEDKIEWCKPWRKSLIIRLIRKRVGIPFLRSRIERLWRLKGNLELIDLENDCFLAKLGDPRDYEFALHGGPWIVVEHYLTVQLWKPNFTLYDEKVKRLAVWRVERAKFVGVCAEIDIRMRLIAKVRVGRRIFGVEYEGMNMICFDCGRYGHKREDCPLLKEKEKNENDHAPFMENLVEDLKKKEDEKKNQEVREVREGENFEPWMMVPKKQRFGNQGRYKTADRKLFRGGKEVKRLWIKMVDPDLICWIIGEKSVATTNAGGGIGEDHGREEEEGKKKKSTVRCFTLGSAHLGGSGSVDGSSAADEERFWIDFF